MFNNYMYLCERFPEGVIAIATTFLTYFASKALFSWKDELKEKKKYNLTQDLLNTILGFETYIQNLTSKQDNEAKLFLQKFFQKFRVFKEEFILLNFKKENLSFLDYFYNLFDKYFNNEEAVATNRSIFLMSIYTSIDKNNEEREKEFYSNIEKAISFCKKEIKNFYN